MANKSGNDYNKSTGKEPFNKKGSKGKQGRGKRNDFEGTKGGMYVNGMAGRENDASWYMQLDTIANDATKISFYNQLGADSQVGVSGNPYNVLPGIMSFDVVTTPGTTRERTDPMNIASINLYEYVRTHLNKPNPDYEAQDLMIMLYCIMQIYAQYSNILRAFGITSQWSMDNLYTPESLMFAGYGWTKEDFDEFISNRANYIAQFNQLIYKAGFLYLPTSFKLMDRYAWLFSNIFRDHHRTKGQYYIHSMKNTYVFSDEGDVGSEGQYLELFVKEPNTTTYHLTMSHMLEVFNDCIDAIRNSTSCRIMQSDVRKAFEDRQAWSLAYADDPYTTPIVDSDEVLSQIENATLFNEWDNIPSASKDITQNVEENIIVFNPKQNTPFQGGVTLHKPVLNFHKDDIAPSDIMVASRQMVVCDLATNLFVASDFISNAYIIYNPGVRDSVSIPDNVWLVPSKLTKDIEKALMYYYSFDWAPAIVVRDESGTALTYEWDNYSVIGIDVLKRLHLVAMLSMWHIPEFTSWSATQ